MSKIEKAVVPFSVHGDLQLAPKDRSWDASAAEGRLRSWAAVDVEEPSAEAWAKYREGFAWYDSENAQTFGAYKLPHHDVIDGELRHHWRGAVAAMTALLGGRGGVDVPDSDKRGIYNHLAKEYGRFDEEPPEFVLRSSELNARRQILACQTKELVAEERVMQFIASDETQDRVGDVIVQSGWDLKAFKKNGVFLWQHDHDIPALGRPIGAEVKETQLRVGVRFASEDANHDLADLVYRLYKDKILSSVSVGFRPIKWDIEVSDEDNEQSMPTYRFKKQELLELSAVNVPANANAVVVNAFAGRFDEKTRGQLVRFGFLPPDVADLTKETREALAHQAADAAKASVDRAVEVLQDSLDRAEKIIERAEDIMDSTTVDGASPDASGAEPATSHGEDADDPVEQIRAEVRAVLGNANKEE